jgi:uncharacterized membrane protein
MRFLTRMPSDPSAVPRPLSCLGTEPFWTLSLLPEGAEWRTPEEQAQVTVSEEHVADRGYFLRAVQGDTLSHALTITREGCTDGMSDRLYGFSARLFTERPDGNTILFACCTLDHR